MSKPRRPTLRDLLTEHGSGVCLSCQSEDDECVEVHVLFSCVSSVHCHECLSLGKVPGISPTIYRRWNSLGAEDEQA